MSESKTALLKFLNTINGSGSFAVSGVKKYEHPSLAVEGLGELTFPINAIQAKALIDVAEAAPFGKGSRTVTDREVRDGWQVDAALLTFQGKKWEKFLQKLVRETARGTPAPRGRTGRLPGSSGPRHALPDGTTRRCRPLLRLRTWLAGLVAKR